MTRGNESWLIVGHGSVGSFVARRLAAGGATVFVFDPAPRVPVTAGAVIESPACLAGTVRNIVSCVSPSAAEGVPAAVQQAMAPQCLYYDWNTIAPTRKRDIDRLTGGRLVDVALLDSLDLAVERPLLAVSGAVAAQAARLLEAHGFDVRVIGSEVGAAAKLKHLRSVFMKGLEALVIEHAVLTHAHDPAGVVRESLERSLGSQFVVFADALITTNRLHAQRRACELQEAVDLFAGDGNGARVAAAAIDVLQRASGAWAQSSAPLPGADVDALVSHLHHVLSQDDEAVAMQSL